VPTPTLAFATRDFAAGVMVTASHNPPEYNGLKLWNPDGSSFVREQQEPLEAMISGDTLPAAPWSEIKDAAPLDGAVERHIARILKDFPEPLNITVVVDAGGGAASEVTPELLEKMGCKVIRLNCDPGGFFPRGSEPVEANLADLKQAVRQSGADLGIAHDGDADRMMAVDERGEFVPGDRLLAVLARALGAREVVTTLDASMIIDELGFSVRRTRVGDTFVSGEMKKHGGDFGGEPSGSWIFPVVSLCPDGIYAAAQVAAIASRQKLSALAGGIPCYPLRRGSVHADGVTLARLEPGLMALEPLSVTGIDGLKLNFEDGWLLVRASGTEPKIRLTAEARTGAAAQQLYDRGLGVIKEAVGSREKV